MQLKLSNILVSEVDLVKQISVKTPASLGHPHSILCDFHEFFKFGDILGVRLAAAN